MKMGHACHPNAISGLISDLEVVAAPIELRESCWAEAALPWEYHPDWRQCHDEAAVVVLPWAYLAVEE